MSGINSGFDKAETRSPIPLYFVPLVTFCSKSKLIFDGYRKSEQKSRIEEEDCHPAERHDYFGRCAAEKSHRQKRINGTGTDYGASPIYSEARYDRTVCGERLRRKDTADSAYGGFRQWHTDKTEETKTRIEDEDCHPAERHDYFGAALPPKGEEQTRENRR